MKSIHQSPLPKNSEEVRDEKAERKKKQCLGSTGNKGYAKSAAMDNHEVEMGNIDPVCNISKINVSAT